MNGAAVKVYSKTKDGGTALSAHFKVREFACSDGTDTVLSLPSCDDVGADPGPLR